VLLARFSNTGMRVDVTKPKIFVEPIECLGYCIIRKDIQPLHDNIETIFNIKALRISNKLHKFIGIMSYFHDR
jgi:hypothetical protein